MKNYTILMFALILGLGINAQEFAEVDKSPMDAAFYPAQAAKRQFAKSDEQRKALEPQIRVLYSRPSLRGREVFRTTDDRKEGITQYGKPWRLGANESTEILLMRDAMIGGKKLKAGRYSMVVVPEMESWTIHINSENDGWGNYSHKPKMDLVTTKVPVTTVDDSLENLGITLYSPDEGKTVHMKMGWGNYRAEMPITLM
ncbi:MAG: DUF2911 domain-containing protein [Nonlabens sp.]